MNKTALLPLRVNQAIESAQYKSELLVSCVQLSVIVIFCIVDYFAPVNFSPNAPVNASTLGLELFGIFTLARLWFSSTKQFTPLLFGLSVISEMILLFCIIWVYSLQYETSITINLKNTHINYVFVLIALRALRFEPIWVILSGTTAALCWCIMVINTVDLSNQSVITWDYVTYASSRSVYPGALFDVLFSIILVTTIIALVLIRAKKMLYAAITQESAAKDLSHFFDLSVVEKITQSSSALEAGYGEVRHAAIMFTDLRGFTNLSRTLSPNEVVGLLGEYQSLLVPIIQKNGGTIDKFIGDGILASFGASAPSSTYAADALRAVDEIIAALVARRTAPTEPGKRVFDVGLGISAGEVVFGVIGHEHRLEYTVIGDTVNTAAKLEKQNKLEHTQALTTSVAYQQARQQGYDVPKEELAARKVGGIEQPLDLVKLA